MDVLNLRSPWNCKVPSSNCALPNQQNYKGPVSITHEPTEEMTHWAQSLDTKGMKLQSYQKLSQ
eukprot:1677277-Amphidinium_carterae.1